MRVHAHVSVVVLNNDGYLIERLIVDNRYNDIARWTYHALPSCVCRRAPHATGRSVHVLTIARCPSLGRWQGAGAVADSLFEHRRLDRGTNRTAVAPC